MNTRNILRTIAVAALLFTSSRSAVAKGQWVQTSLNNVHANAFAYNGSTLFAGYENGVYATTDDGVTWSMKNNGLLKANINTFTLNDAIFFAGRLAAGVYCTTNIGLSWVSRNTGLPITVNILQYHGNDLFAGTWYGDEVYCSTNNGINFTKINSGLTNTFVNAFDVAFDVIDTNIFAGTCGDGVYCSSDTGNNWTKVDNGLTNLQITCLTSMNGYLYAGTSGGGIFKSTNNGIMWSPMNNGFTNYDIESLITVGNDLFAGTLGSGVWRRSSKTNVFTSPLDFDSVAIGECKADTLMLTNTGTTPDTINGMSFLGAYAAEYSVLSITYKILPPGETENIVLLFLPVGAPG